MNTYSDEKKNYYFEFDLLSLCSIVIAEYVKLFPLKNYFPDWIAALTKLPRKFKTGYAGRRVGVTEFDDGGDSDSDENSSTLLSISGTISPQLYILFILATSDVANASL